MRTSARSVAWEQIAPPATLLLVSLLASAPLWGPGLLNTRGGGDSPFLLVRTHQLAANLRAGVFPARWMPDAAYGLGYPFFSYYAALPYYLAAGLSLVGLGILTSLKLTQTLFMGAAALAMYAWALRVLRSRSAAWLAGAAYTVAPFHLVNLYVRGDSLSEFAAFAFFPVVLWGLDRLAAEPSLRRALMPGLAYAGLILSHNVSALIFSPFLVLYVVCYIGRSFWRQRERSPREVLGQAALFLFPVLLGLLLSAWFWLPAIGETRYVQLDAQTTGYFFYGNHFRRADLVQPGLLFSYDTGTEAGSPFAMGLGQALLLALGFLSVGLAQLRGRRGSPFSAPGQGAYGPPGVRGRLPGLVLAAAGCLIATAMITPLSRPLWDHVPMLSLVQFPWRFLSLQALFGSLFIGALARPAERLGTLASWTAAVLLGSMLAAGALLGLRPEYLPIGESDITTERLRLYELFTGNIGSTIRYEYLPRWVEPRPRAGPKDISPRAPARAIPVEGELLRAERTVEKPVLRVWHVEAGDHGARIAFPLLYWPGWGAAIDGAQVDVAAAVSSGYVTVEVPPGGHTVEFRLGRTPLRRWAEWLSLLSLLATAVLDLRARRHDAVAQERLSSKKTEPADSPRQTRRGLGLATLPFLGLLALAAVFQPRVSTAGVDDLTMDFERMPYLHHNPNGVRRDGWQLTSYAYDRPNAAPFDHVGAGDTFGVTLRWRLAEGAGGEDGAAGPLGADLRLVSPATVRRADLPALAETSFTVDPGEAAPGSAGSTAITLTVPNDAPPGLHLIQVAGAPAHYLRPLWITDGPHTPHTPPAGTFADGALALHDLSAFQRSSDRLVVQIDWSAARPVAANYGLSLSLTDPAGNEWLLQGNRPGYDSQPGLGFLPTSIWPLDRLFKDRHAIRVAAGAPPGDKYDLTADLYDVTTWQSVGTYSETVSLTEVSRRPNAPVLARLSDQVALSSLDLPGVVRQGETLEATAYWAAKGPPTRDYVAAWELKGEERIISATLPLAPGSSARDWPADAWIAGRASLAILPTTPPGLYTITVTLLDEEYGDPVGSYSHPDPVEIAGRERIWELPPMERTVDAAFGGMIELAGYDLEQEGDQLRLTLHWRALETPDRHYTFFVHLADPESGIPASQVDGMPRGFTYPTGQWAPGEVISDKVEVPTEGIPGGRYVLAVGWYDPNSKLRLPAVDSQGTPIPDDRVILQDAVAIP